MTPILRVSSQPLLILSLALMGCGEAADTSAPEASSAPAEPTAPSTEASPTASTPASEASAPVTEPEPTPAAAPEKTADAPKDASATPAATEPAAAEPAVKAAATDGASELQPVKFDDFLKRVANKDAKYTIVDVWASWCLPCKENFPHLVEMHKKFAGKGLSVASLSFDDPAEPKQVADAKEFLAAKKAVFPNYLLDEEQGVGYERLNIGAIPAVFIYGPDGKEVKRYTMDDPNNQFTYEEVEKDVVALLDGKPLPKSEKSKPDAK